MKKLDYKVCSFFISITTYYLLSHSSAFADPPQFSKPVDCIPGVECIIQQYVDLDPSSNTKDFRCGDQTYNGHKGTDFRLMNAKTYERGVQVIASAAGTVLRIRDGIEDRQVRNASDRAIVKDMKCGNGLVIDHGEGWESQYCHLRKGSLTVQKGQSIAKGSPLGIIGLSGFTQMPHLHISIRHEGKVVDPYSGFKIGDSNNIYRCEDRGEPLWDDETLRSFSYASSQILEVGFTALLLAIGEREALTEPEKITSSSDKLVLFVRVLNFLKGDQIRFMLTGPDGFRVENIVGPLKRNKARYVSYVGKKRRLNLWPKGTYEGIVTTIRKGKTIDRKVVSIDLK